MGVSKRMVSEEEHAAALVVENRKRFRNKKCLGVNAWWQAGEDCAVVLLLGNRTRWGTALLFCNWTGGGWGGRQVGK